MSKPNKESLIDVDYLKSVINYDSDTGLLTWAKSYGNAIEGDVAGCLKASGYWIVGLRGEKYLAHRLAWLWVNGAWPVNQIDHINGNKLDNRMENLRDVLPHVNMQNHDHFKRPNKSGITGVYWKESKGGWFAGISVKGTKINRGPYKTKERASEVREMLRRQHHGDAKLPPPPVLSLVQGVAPRVRNERGNRLFHDFAKGVK